MLTLLAAFARPPEPQLYAWPTDVGQERRLVLAATLPDRPEGSTLVFDLASKGAKHEVACRWTATEVICGFTPLAPRCASCETSLVAPLGIPTELGGARLFAGLRADPSPARLKKAARRRRSRDVPDAPGEVVLSPVEALVLELPASWLGEAGPLEVGARLVERTWSEGVLRAASVDPSTCEGAVRVTVEPDPWSPGDDLVALLYGNGVVFARRPEIVLPSTEVRGTQVGLWGDHPTCALTGATGEVLACGPVTIAAHVTPLCDTPVHDELLAAFGRPVLPRTPTQLDLLDGVEDGTEHDLLTAGPLRLDLRHACSPTASTYLENERALARAREPVSCGGRTPGGQALDVLLTHAVNGPERLPPGSPYWGDAPASDAPRRTDGVQAPEPLGAFPWLAAP